MIWRGHHITVLYLDCEDVLKFKELYTPKTVKTFLYDNLGNKINKLKIQSSVLFIHSVTLLLSPPKKCYCQISVTLLERQAFGNKPRNLNTTYNNIFKEKVYFECP